MKAPHVKLPHFRRLRAVSGFTLVEIMIVVLIIGILVSVAVPVFVQARETSRAKSCVANLKQIDSAKQQWAMDTKAGTAATPGSTDLSPNYLRVFPMCPQTNTAYSINSIGIRPTCSIGTTTGTNFAHTLP